MTFPRTFIVEGETHHLRPKNIQYHIVQGSWTELRVICTIAGEWGEVNSPAMCHRLDLLEPATKV